MPVYVPSLPLTGGTLTGPAAGPIFATAAIIAADLTIPDGYNAFSVGPVTVSRGVTVTVPHNSTWKVL